MAVAPSKECRRIQSRSLKRRIEVLKWMSSNANLTAATLWGEVDHNDELD